MGPEPAKIQQTVRFGRDFEIDPSLYELRRAGRALKLERIPMEILLLLVNERGRVVGRQEIADNVWGKRISLDADNSINGAIRKIRQVLKDDPEQPRFIQTITGRGYRFIAPVATDEPQVGNSAPEPAAPEADNAASSTAEAVAVHSADAKAAISSADPDTPARPVRRWRRILLTAAAVLIAAASLLVWSQRAERREVSHGKVRLAVLPFQNLTGDPAQDYYSDGFTEEMITQLGKLDPRRLAVIARTSVMYYKSARTPLRQIARDLAVQYVLEGSVRRDASNVRITAQLIQVQDQTHVWSREYDRAPKDLLAIQSEIAKEIAGEIQLTLDNQRPNTAAARAALSSQEYEAHDLYLRGRYLWSKRSLEALQGAVSWFKRAIARDPNYARAYAGLADSYAIMSSYGYVPVNVYMPLARTAALKALQLDNSLAEAHTSLALIAENYDWDWRTAEKEYRRAIQLNSNYSTAHHWLAECLALQGRFQEALDESERARELDPLSLIIATDDGAIYYFSRQYDRAISRFRAVLDVDPSLGRAHLIIPAYVQQGRFEDALADLDRWRRRVGDGPWAWSWEAYIYGRMGNLVRARQAFERIEKANQPWSLDLAPLYTVAYAGLGDKEKCLASLEQAYREHSNLPTNLKVDPLYDPLRGAPRFQKLLRGVGLDR
ncbi:MAG: winged helix-turn-helix domain-containing protein [Bryobacteraceae bacterium]